MKRENRFKVETIDDLSNLSILLVTRFESHCCSRIQFSSRPQTAQQHSLCNIPCTGEGRSVAAPLDLLLTTSILPSLVITLRCGARVSLIWPRGRKNCKNRHPVFPYVIPVLAPIRPESSNLDFCLSDWRSFQSGCHANGRKI